MYQIDTQCYSDTKSQYKDSCPVDQKRNNSQYDPKSRHSTCDHHFILNTGHIGHTKAGPCSDDKSKDHHPEPEDTVSQDAVQKSEDTENSVYDHHKLADLFHPSCPLQYVKSS